MQHAHWQAEGSGDTTHDGPYHAFPPAIVLSLEDLQDVVLLEADPFRFLGRVRERSLGPAFDNIRHGCKWGGGRADEGTRCQQLELLGQSCSADQAGPNSVNAGVIRGWHPKYGVQRSIKHPRSTQKRAQL